MPYLRLHQGVDDYATHIVFKPRPKQKPALSLPFPSPWSGKSAMTTAVQETLAELEGPPRILMNWARNPKHYRIENTWDPFRFRSDVTLSKTPVGRLLAILGSLSDYLILKEALKMALFRNISKSGRSPPTLGTFGTRIQMSLLAKKSGFQGQKQWPPKFHIKCRIPGTPSPLSRKYF